MVALDNNNGDAISCIVLMLDNLAYENNSLVSIETLHEDSCSIFNYMEDESLTNDILAEREPTSVEALEHLYACDCDTTIEAVFTRGEGETLFVPFTLSDVRLKHPWLNDEEDTKEMLDSAREIGRDSYSQSPLMQKIKSTFKKRVGTVTRSKPPEVMVFGSNSSTMN